ncbi:MAG: condensation domain-containing protein [Planctomycetota bacterium]
MNQDPNGKDQSRVKEDDFRQRINQLNDLQRLRLAELLAENKGEKVGQIDGPKQICLYVVPSDSAGVKNSSEVKEFLQSSLPPYMIPDRILIVDRLEKLPNGKVDKKRLPHPNVVENVDDSIQLPQTEIEIILADIWSQLLFIDPIGVNDNFFEIGGDSILSIQVISKVREAGLEIEPRQLASYPTIAELASVIRWKRSTSDTELNSPVLAGSDAVSPIQQWFFERELSAPDQWNLTAAFQVNGQFTADDCMECIGACLQNHPIMRSSFTQNGSSITLESHEDFELKQFINIEQVCGNDWSKLEPRIEEISKGLDIEDGPLIQFTIVQSKNDDEYQAASEVVYLLIIAHHLIMDPISFSIVKRDLQTGLTQLKENRAIRLTPATTDLRRWAIQVRQLVEKSAPEFSSDFWTRLCEGSKGTLPVVDANFSLGTEVEALSYILRMGVSETRLLQSVPQSTGVSIQEILVTALALVLSDWMEDPFVRFDMEGHGRQALSNQVDLSHSIGWFTSYFPMAVEVGRDETVARDERIRDVLKRVKESIRGLPFQGMGYGAIRYFDSDTFAKSNLGSFQPNDVLFNYSGVIEASNHEKMLVLHHGLQAICDNHCRAGINQRSHLVELNAAIEDGELCMRWVFDSSNLAETTVKKWAEVYQQFLNEIISNCVSADEKAFTPVDFPESGMNQDELDQFLDGLS